MLFELWFAPPNDYALQPVDADAPEDAQLLALFFAKSLAEAESLRDSWLGRRE